MQNRLEQTIKEECEQLYRNFAAKFHDKEFLAFLSRWRQLHLGFFAVLEDGNSASDGRKLRIAVDSLLRERKDIFFYFLEKNKLSNKKDPFFSDFIYFLQEHDTRFLTILTALKTEYFNQISQIQKQKKIAKLYEDSRSSFF